MYLPVYLLDRYGWLAFFIFAIPNLFGVMLFGWSLKRHEVSRAFVLAHQSAMIAFSLITVAFHVYAIAWIAQHECQLAPWITIAAAIILLYIAIASGLHLSLRMLLRLGALAFLISITAFAITAINTDANSLFSGSHPVITQDTLATTEAIDLTLRTPFWEHVGELPAIYLLPIMILGFLTCPFFDLTFHRAYQQVSARGGGKAGTTTFIWFAILFAPILLFTTVYARTGFTWIIVIHILVQAWFTMTVHIHELIRTKPFANKPRRVCLLFPIALVAPLALIPLSDYRHWMFFYGIFFPAYALLVICRRMVDRTTSHLITIAVLLLICVPFAWVGFVIPGSEWGLTVPIAILVAWFILGPSQTNKCDTISSNG